MVIWKYPIPLGTSSLRMPRGARLLCVQMQENMGYLWALVDQSSPLVDRHIAIVGTGWTLESLPGEYVGTLQADGYVWHIFDRGKSE